MNTGTEIISSSSPGKKYPLYAQDKRPDGLRVELNLVPKKGKICFCL
jgi:hypothetical protein